MRQRILTIVLGSALLSGICSVPGCGGNSIEPGVPENPVYTEIPGEKDMNKATQKKAH